MSRAVRLCPALVIVRPDFQKYRRVSEQVFAIYRSVTPLVEPLSLDEAYLDVTENAWQEPLGVTVAKRIKQIDPRDDRPDRLGRRRPEQVPREDRVGLEEAERADRHRARAHRVVSPGSAGRRAVGRRATHRRAASRPRHRAARRCPRAVHRLAADRRRQLGAVAARPGDGPRRSPRRAESRTEVVRLGVHLRKGPDRSQRDRPRSRRDGPRRRALAGQARDVRQDGRDQSALRRLHDHHAQSKRSPPDAR